LGIIMGIMHLTSIMSHVLTGRRAAGSAARCDRRTIEKTTVLELPTVHG
jgi:hypothetical protein